MTSTVKRSNVATGLEHHCKILKKRSDIFSCLRTQQGQRHHLQNKATYFGRTNKRCLRTKLIYISARIVDFDDDKNDVFISEVTLRKRHLCIVVVVVNMASRLPQFLGSASSAPE